MKHVPSSAAAGISAVSLRSASPQPEPRPRASARLALGWGGRLGRISAALCGAAAWLGLLGTAGLAPAADDLAKGFAQPPAAAKPWVYWFWLNGNISSNGITADLEAMKRVGIGGVLIMEVDQGAPVGPADFMGTQWRDLFKHVVGEARRLGLAVNMNNDAGWNGSGGPWITPEVAMQKVVWSETNLSGPTRFEATLPQPETVAGYYRDISVVAFPAVGAYRIDRIRAKAAFETASVGDIARDKLAPEMVIERSRLIPLSAQMDSQGRLAWDVPAGNWTLLRLGHTCTGVENAPAPKTGRGLECDKLSPEGIEANFAAMMAKLTADTGTKPGRGVAGLVATHIDSWENGSQNWTPRLREEFQKRRGYDLFSYLPVFTGRVVDSLEISERFLRDLRQTISELVIENYAGRMRELAQAQGLRFTVEAYGSPCDNVPYGGQADEPMGEFWSPSGAMETCKGMAGAAHVYGKRIVGAEAFTAGDGERWREHPALIKALGDRAFCEGINRFVFHRYALQPWVQERRPGMTMGPWGQHYERTQTWWEHTSAWHEYLARCQFLLRQGLFVADICYVQPELPPQGFGSHPRRGYDWDECSAALVQTRLAVKDGRLMLPDGMSYRVLVLPQTATMTPALLRKTKELVQAGATVIGQPPRQSPSLTRYPQCDEEVKQLALEIWGDCDGLAVKERQLGQGRIVWSNEPEKVLRQAGVQPDFSSGQPLHYLHRATENTDLYFVANSTPREVTTTATFRISGKVPELWWPVTGRMERAPIYRDQDGRTSVSLRLEPSGSVFVVFRDKVRRPDPVVSLSRNGQAIASALPEPPPPIVIQRAAYGVPNDPQRTRDVRAKVQSRVDAGEYSFPAAEMAEGDDPAPTVVKTLTVDYTFAGRPFSVKARDPIRIYLTGEGVNIQVEKARYGVLDDPKRTRDVREKVQRLVDAGESSFQVARMAEGDDPAFLVVKTLEIEGTRDGERFSARGTDPEIIDLKKPVQTLVEREAEVEADAAGRLVLTVFKPGRYELQTAANKRYEFNQITAVPAFELHGPWQVRFATNLGAPQAMQFERLVSWSALPEPGVKYYSGTATYTHTLMLPGAVIGRDHRLFLDLGRVEVMADVKLNGKRLGLLWKAPYRVEITDIAKPGANELEIAVVNLWPNRMIGDEQLPEDSERNPDGTLKAWPQWLQAGQPSPSGRVTFTSWRLWKKSDGLLASGLLGPVTVEIGEVKRF